MKEDITTWDDDKLQRKAEQEASMRGLALQDNDVRDAERHHKLELKYLTELKRR